MALWVNQPRDSWEGLRSTLGLMVEEFLADCFFIDAPVELAGGRGEDDFQDNLDLLADLDGQCYTNTRQDAERFQFMTYASLEEMAARLPDYHLVIPLLDLAGRRRRSS